MPKLRLGKEGFARCPDRGDQITTPLMQENSISSPKTPTIVFPVSAASRV